ncbi:acadsb [Symbiodinium natans]|uniref:Short/branched chain specific acyl-CoA dehydrogenase, mitochondrial n=1 Tax=Symbiodinium natans TaxID=878477 RepID=A0A812QUB9_9DINO|nr:acadsb [Symbiodinium natans]
MRALTRELFRLGSRSATEAARARPLLHASQQLRLFSEGRLASTQLSSDEEMIRGAAESFATEILAPKVQEMDRDAKMSPEILKALFENGLMGIEVPEDLGGVGLGFTAACLAIEELARVDPAVAAMVDIHNTLNVTAFSRYATPELRDQYLARMATDTVSSFCLSEPGSGSDAFALSTRAVKDGNDWIINGSKCWISSSLEAGVFIVFATVDPRMGHRGITAFVMDRDTPGLSIGKKEDKLGIRASSTCEVILEGCRVPSSAVLGEVGKGYKIAIELLNEGRIGIGAQMVGLARGAFDYALQYMVSRKQFGQPVADFQGMQFQYARAAMEIEAARVLVYNAARLKESGEPFVNEACFAKLKASEVAQSVSSQCIDWLGGVGFTKEFLAEKYYRDAKIGTIYEGTSNIQLQTIAKSIRQQFPDE